MHYTTVCPPWCVRCALKEFAERYKETPLAEIVKPEGGADSDDDASDWEEDEKTLSTPEGQEDQDELIIIEGALSLSTIKYPPRTCLISPSYGAGLGSGAHSRSKLHCSHRCLEVGPGKSRTLGGGTSRLYL